MMEQKTVDYTKVANAVECCKECSADACDRCPYITEGCDEPEVKLVRIPMFLLEDLSELLKYYKGFPVKFQ